MRYFFSFLFFLGYQQGFAMSWETEQTMLCMQLEAAGLSKEEAPDKLRAAEAIHKDLYWQGTSWEQSLTWIEESLQVPSLVQQFAEPQITSSIKGGSKNRLLVEFSKRTFHPLLIELFYHFLMTSFLH